ncbi:dihydrodipicolinate synthase family protein [Variovorax fucosicus]|uniref:dihydrodipicolinate synthase family protein n=1 Tax=Variovorax fucosicus TaxID=3053517 RepID=UPI002576BA4A|nr:dihydrodipicolinate synthase family protein [Variovorax sp. J22G47]MDM0059216.1 dihydrodipicolinate synthase family protein [Variovorax sp. J22G47]
MNPSALTAPSSTQIWAAIPTPFSASLALDVPGLRHNAQRYIALGLRGVFCNGLMGEVWALSHAERRRIVEVLVDEGRGRLGVSAVVSASSIEETLELGVHAKRVGVDHAVLMVPTSGPRSDEQQMAYFRYVCDRLDMPVVIFNAATAAGSPLRPEVFAKLCDLPQLKMLKTTAYADNDALRRAARNGVVVSDPLEEHFFTSYTAHAQRILYADPEPFLYQVPGHCPVAAYAATLDSGVQAQAQEAFAALSPLRKVFNKWVMDPLMRGHMPCAALKHWCDLIGLAGGTVRQPLQPLSIADKQKLKADLMACNAPGLASTDRK